MSGVDRKATGGAWGLKDTALTAGHELSYSQVESRASPRRRDYGPA